MSLTNAFHLGKPAKAESVPSLPISCAVLCVDCERISISQDDVCPVCGSRSLFNVAQMLGGTLSPVRAKPAAKLEEELEIPRCA